MAEKPNSRFRKIQARVRTWLNDFRIHSRSESEMNRVEKFAHFWVMVGKNFWRNRCPVRASALAYTTLLALVPLLAVAISISTTLFKQKGNEQQVTELINTMVAKVAPQLDLVSKSDERPLTEAQLQLRTEMLAKYDTNQNGRFDQLERNQFSEEDQLTMDRAGIARVSGRERVAESITAYIKNVSSGTLGTTAVIALIFVAISLLSTIEATLNDIWGVSQGRSWFSRIVQYWAVICFAPLFILLAMGLNAGPYFETTQKIINSIPFGNFVYQLLPLVMLFLVFTFFYKMMPNTKVLWQAALVGGFVGGCLWHLNNQFSVIYFGQVVRNSQIYGKLAILPVFLLGIYLSWLIVLFGAQVAYVFQNRRAYIQERRTENVNERGIEFVALRLMTFIAQQFHWGERPSSAEQIAESLGVPSQLIRKVTRPLLKSKLILCVASGTPDETAYAPSRPLEQISYQDILDSIRTGIGEELATRDEPARNLVRGKFNEILAAEGAVASGITLRMLVQEPRIG